MLLLPRALKVTLELAHHLPSPTQTQLLSLLALATLLLTTRLTHQSPPSTMPQSLLGTT